MNLLPWLDDLVELAPLLDRIIKDGVSLTVFVGIAVFFLKKYRKLKPTQLDRIERKVDILAERQGIQWDAQDSKSSSETSATKSGLPSISHWVGYITARIVRVRASRLLTKSNIPIGTLEVTLIVISIIIGLIWR